MRFGRMGWRMARKTRWMGVELDWRCCLGGSRAPFGVVAVRIWSSSKTEGAHVLYSSDSVMRLGSVEGKGWIVAACLDYRVHSHPYIGPLTEPKILYFCSRSNIDAPLKSS